MDFNDLSLAAIRDWLGVQEQVDDSLIEALSRDSRAGVRALAAAATARRERRLREEAEQVRMLELESSFHARGLTNVAGVDEAGRGPLAGPVVAAAVVFPPGCDYPPARDSKQLDEARREQLFDLIQQRAAAVGVGQVESEEIDRLNIHQASLKAMYLAVKALGGLPVHAVLVDGPMVLRLGCPQEAVIGGDAKCLSIAAASVVAKVTRDRLMKQYDLQYPGYGFARHKGYCTPDHEAALRELGPCPIHRRTFHQVARLTHPPLSESCLAFHQSLTRAATPDELETVARQIRQVRDSFSGLELDSLRRRYLKTRRELGR